MIDVVVSDTARQPVCDWTQSSGSLLLTLFPLIIILTCVELALEYTSAYEIITLLHNI